MTDDTSELRQIILYKLLKYGNDQAEDLKPDADVVSNEILGLLAAQRQRWEVAARIDEREMITKKPYQVFIDGIGKEYMYYSLETHEERITALDGELGKEQ